MLISLTTRCCRAVALSSATLALALPGAAVAQTPASLTGEVLSDSVNDPDTLIEATCDQGGTSTIHYRFVNGAAVGPYVGSFGEEGTITIGPQTNPFVPPGPGFTPSPTGNAQVNATFTIDSPAGQITGEKSTPAGTFGQGICREFSGEVDGRPFNGSEYAAKSDLSYTALITTSAGTFRDTGTSSLHLLQGKNVGTPPNLFDGGLFTETFLTSAGVTPVLPTSKDQCKNGGWQVYGVFKNQGDCESFVATGGKNPPANP